MPTTNLELNGMYEIVLCSGERVRWQYLGPDSRSAVWWRDLETGSEFNEASRMYAWRVIGFASDEVNEDHERKHNS